jgi:hypothetical protein
LLCIHNHISTYYDFSLFFDEQAPLQYRRYMKLLYSNKKSKYVALSLLASVLLIAAVAASVNAQGQATVNVLPAVGGSTTPSGTQTYDAGTTVTLDATPDPGYVVNNWVISSTSGNITDVNAPTTLTVTGGVTYTIDAIFVPLLVPPGQNPTPVSPTDAIVGVFASAGGATNPPSGVYRLANATQLKLTATPNSGWQFSHWVISSPTGAPMDGHPPTGFTPTPTDNPYTVDHGYGNRYDYQAVFTPVGSSPGPSPTIPEYSNAAVIVIAVVLAAIAVGTYAVKRQK